MSTSMLVLYIGLGAIAIVIVYALIKNRNDNKLQEERYREFWNVKKDGDDDIGYHPDPIPPGSESIFIPSLSVKIIDFYQERYGLLCQWEDQTDAGQIIVVRLKPPSMVKSIKELTDTSHLGLFLGRDGISVNLDSGSLIIEVPKKRSKPLLLGPMLAEYEPALDKFCLGYDRRGKIVELSLDKSKPHCVIQGETGSGKTVATRAILANIIVAAKAANISRDMARIIVYDPKGDLDPIETPSLSFVKNHYLVDKFATDAGEFSKRLDDLCNEIKNSNRDNIFKGTTFVICDETADIINNPVGGRALDYIAQMGRGYNVFLVWATGGITNAFTGNLKYLQNATQHNLFLGHSNRYTRQAQGGQAASARGRGDANYQRSDFPNGGINIQIAMVDSAFEQELRALSSARKIVEKAATKSEWDTLHPLTVAYFNSIEPGNAISIVAMRKYYADHGVSLSSNNYNDAKKQWELATQMFNITRASERTKATFGGVKMEQGKQNHRPSRWYGREQDG